jgi:hypothetical protein
MASDETRRLLKEFGIAVTDYEDAVTEGASREKVAKVEAEVKARLAEVTALIQRLSSKKK